MQLREIENWGQTGTRDGFRTLEIVGQVGMEGDGAGEGASGGGPGEETKEAKLWKIVQTLLKLKFGWTVIL